MSRIIPKEQLTAYQRWELGSVDPLHERVAAPTAVSPATEDETILSVPMPTAEDLERIQQEAWQEGHALGYGDGRKAGYEAGYQEGKKAGEVHAQRLRQLAAALQVETLRQDEAIAREVMELGLNVAQQMMRATIKAHPESILVVIREALLSLPTLSGHHRVVVNPADVDIVREWLTKEHGHLSWKVVEDDQISQGGFRFESAHSEVDATMETRWREIAACLGTDTTWMA
jgi:flagellar assembly protein FliH